MAKAISLSEIEAKSADSAEALESPDKPKVQAGVDTDGTVFQVTLPLMVNEADITTGKAKRANGEEYSKANVCFAFQAKGLTLGVRMNDGTTRYYKVKNNAGIYGPTRYISLGFDPSVYFTRPADSDSVLDANIESNQGVKTEAAHSTE